MCGRRGVLQTGHPLGSVCTGTLCVSMHSMFVLARAIRLGLVSSNPPDTHAVCCNGTWWVRVVSGLLWRCVGVAPDAAALVAGHDPPVTFALSDSAPTPLQASRPSSKGSIQTPG